MVDQREMSRVLVDLAGTVVADFPILVALERLVTLLDGVVALDGCSVGLVASDGELEAVAASDVAAQRLQRIQIEQGAGPSLVSCRTGRPVCVVDAQNDDRYPGLAAAATNGDVAAVYSFPLRDGASTIGALDVYRASTVPLDESERAAVETLVQVVSTYIVCTRAKYRADATASRFEEMSLRDPLTGLGNRRLLLERIEHAKHRSRRVPMIAAIVFIDLDRFKSVNDDFGHHVGDALLTAVADRLKELVRVEDTLARIAGDEFVVFCESLSGPEDAKLLVSRIERSIAEPFELESHTVHMHASVGVALTSLSEEIDESLIIEADAEMYEKKRWKALKELMSAL